MFGHTKRNRGAGSLALAGLVGVIVIGCTAAAPVGNTRAVSHPQARDGRHIGDPYQAGGRSAGEQTQVNVRQLTGTHPGGGGPQE